MMFLFLTLSAPFAATQKLPDMDDWKVVRTANFELYTNSQARHVTKLGLELEGLRALLAVLTPEGVLTSSKPTTIYVFDSQKSFWPFTPRDEKGRHRRDLAGYFLSPYDGNFMALVGETFGEPSFQTVLHEYVHFVIDHTMPNVPAWFNEGAAQYYSSYLSMGKTVEVGRPGRGTMQELGRRGWGLSMEELLGVTYDSPTYRGGSARFAFYAESWALVYYFYHSGPERLGDLQEYIALVNDGVDRDEAFGRAFETDYASFQDEVWTYLRSNRLQVRRFEKKALAIDEQVSVEPLSENHARCRLAELLAHMGEDEFPAADNLFRAVADSDDGDGCGLRGLGYLERERGNRERAEELFARAAERDPDDYLTLLYRGENLSHMVQEERAADAVLAAGLDEAPGGEATGDDAGEPTGELPPPEESPEEAQAAEAVDGDTEPELTDAQLARLDAARGHFRRAIDLRPEYGEAWVELGRTWSLEPEPPLEAVAALQRGLSLMPFRDDVAISLARMYAALGRPDHVDATLRGTTRSRFTDEGLERMEELELVARFNAAERLREDGDTAGAIAQLEQLLAAEPGDELRAEAEDALEQLRDAATS